MRFFYVKLDNHLRLCSFTAGNELKILLIQTRKLPLKLSNEEFFCHVSK